MCVCVSASAADAATVNLRRIRTLLADVSITFFINGNTVLVFSNGPSNLLKNPPGYIILDNWVFGNLISVNKQFAKACEDL